MLSSSQRKVQFVWGVGVVLIGSMVFVALVHQFATPIVTAAFGPQYLPFVSIFVLLSLIVAPQSLAKLWGVLCSSTGSPWISTVVDVAKISCVLVGLHLLSRQVTDAAVTLVVSEYVAILIALAVFAATQRRGSPRR